MPLPRRLPLLVAGLAATVAALAACPAPRGDDAAGRTAGAPGAEAADGAGASVGRLERLDPAFDAVVAPDAHVERLAGGFTWSEGPVWRPREGDLLFSDVPRNVIWRWHERDGLSVWLRPAGLAAGTPPGRELGSNGLALDREGRLVMADHGNRQVARLDTATFTKTTLADRHEGRRLNSPNDVVVAADGSVYFTDPPYGLDGQHDDPAKELPHAGVYRVSPAGAITLLSTELRFPNGIALSPDGRTLYVANSDPARAIWMAWALAPDGTASGGRVLFDATSLVSDANPGLPDGLKVAQDGTLLATGPGGVLVLTPDGRHLGTIRTPQATANVAFGDDGRSLYLTSSDRLLRVRLGVVGAGF